MDQSSLVTEQIDAGSQLAKEFNEYAKLRAAFWVKESDTGHWYFYLVSDQIDDSNFDLAYGELVRIEGKHRNEWIDPFQVKVAGVDDSVARAVLKIQQELSSTVPTRLRQIRLGDLFVDELCLYPPIKPKQLRKKTGKR
jgi:hypothetical protein